MTENPKQLPSLTITILLVILSLALSLAWIWQMVFVIPELERTFTEFRIRAPAFTQATFDASRFVVSFWYIVVPFVLLVIYPAIAFVSYYLRHRSRRRGLSRLWFVLIIGLPLAGQAITLLSVLIPIYRVDGIRGIR
jgi:type IV pilus assembly protein PilC